MNLPNISEVYIVEDNLRAELQTALVFPKTLIEEEAIDLKESFIDIKDSYSNIWMKIEGQLEEKNLKDALLAFIDNLNSDPDSLIKLNEWYLSGGKEKWESVWRSDHYRDEYSFLENLPVKEEFTNYQDALNYVKKSNGQIKKKNLKLWFLDREIGQENYRDKDILSLLNLLSLEDNSIGIVYSARTESLQTKGQIYQYVKDIIDESKPTEINDTMKEFLGTLQSQYTNSLFLDSDNFLNEMSHSFDQIYESKADLNNLVWVMGKGILEKDIITDIIQKAIHGFELYKLLKLHTVEKKQALTNGLLDTTKLELEDIEHLKNKSIIEGTNISNTLIRINDIYSNKSFNDQLSMRKDYFEMIKNIEAWKQLGNQKNPNINFNELLSMEKFDYNVNSLFKPIMTGDIFEVYASESGKSKNSRTLYMLVTQECDCVIRKSGVDKFDRSVEKATFIEMDIVKEPVDANTLISELLLKLDKEIDDDEKRKALEEVFISANKQVAAAANEKRLSLAPLLANDEYNNTTLLLRKTLHVNFKLLDLCMLNSTGETKFDLDDLDNIRKNIVTLYPKFYQEYLKKLIAEVLIESQNVNASFQKKIEKRTMENYLKSGNIIDYRLKRIARVNMPHQAFIQAYYGLTQSNVGLPMDL